jgi:peptidoglycan/LPS O-acetylase OafA/YrhL
MFLTLLLVTFAISVLVSFFVAHYFKRPIDRILKRIIADEISDAWVKYIIYA